jgi:hypothetical protein
LDHDYATFPVSLSASIDNVSVLNYASDVFTEALQNDLNPHAAARRTAVLRAFEELLESLGEEWSIKHTTVLNEQASMDNLYLSRRSYETSVMDCTIMAVGIDPSLPTHVGIGQVRAVARKDLLEEYETWYLQHNRTLSDEYFRVTSEMICQAVAVGGKNAIVQVGQPTPSSPYPTFRCLVAQNTHPCQFAVAFVFICPKKMLRPRK